MADADPPNDGANGSLPEVLPLGAGADPSGQEDTTEQMVVLTELLRRYLEQMSTHVSSGMLQKFVHMLETKSTAKEVDRLELAALAVQTELANSVTRRQQDKAEVAEMTAHLVAKRKDMAERAEKHKDIEAHLKEAVRAWEEVKARASGSPRLKSMAELELERTQKALEQSQKEIVQLKALKAPSGNLRGVKPRNQVQPTRDWAQMAAQGVGRNSQLVLSIGAKKDDKTIILTANELGEAKTMQLPSWADPKMSGHWLMVCHPKGMTKSEAEFQRWINDISPKNTMCEYHQCSEKAGIVLVRSVTWGQSVIRLRRAGMTPLTKMAPWELGPGESDQSAMLTKMTQICKAKVESGGTRLDTHAAKWLLMAMADADKITLPADCEIRTLKGQGEPGQIGSVVSLPGPAMATMSNGPEEMEQDQSRGTKRSQNGAAYFLNPSDREVGLAANPDLVAADQSEDSDEGPNGRSKRTAGEPVTGPRHKKTCGCQGPADDPSWSNCPHDDIVLSDDEEDIAMANEELGSKDDRATASQSSSEQSKVAATMVMPFANNSTNGGAGAVDGGSN
ncbi:hypothetical protein H4S03_003521 [Coemansia sp. S3946]|nr:hypothetical protein H4S03_003521 [Coemansia sp. S3946]